LTENETESFHISKILEGRLDHGRFQGYGRKIEASIVQIGYFDLEMFHGKGIRFDTEADTIEQGLWTEDGKLAKE